VLGGSEEHEMVLTRTRLTEEQFMRLPEDGRKYELVDGEATEVPANFEHGMIGAIIISLLMPSAKHRGAMTTGQAGFRMHNGNIRCPDVSFTRKERLPGGKAPRSFGDAAPDLCIEIISPSEEKADMLRKIDEYFNAGAEQVWHVFPESEQVIIFSSPSEAKTYDSADELDGGNLLPGFRCCVSDLFAME
jgi:Uma2 family endonuclease